MTQFAAAELIRSGSAVLEKAGIENAAHDAKRLLKAALAGASDAGGLLNERDLSDTEKAHFESLIERRAGREPLQHILGSASILDLDIKTDHRALIPRDDSAELILLAMRRLETRKDDPLTIADLGTGTGVLLAECLAHFKQARGIAVEQSAKALSLADENFTALGQKDRVELFQGSWTDWQDWGACDLILSNPPYIRTDVLSSLAPEVRDFDPVQALDGGPDGLTAYREIITLGASFMKPGAHLALEIGFDQKSAVSALLDAAGFTNLEQVQDLGGFDRAIAATKT